MSARRPTSLAPEGEADAADGHPCSISAYPSGPFLVRGTFELLDEEGVSLGLRRRTIALCRCGRTRRSPFCDGTHKLGRVTSAPPVAPELPDAA